MPTSKKDNELYIGIIAETDGLKKGFKEAEKDVAKFGDEAKKTAKKTEEISKSSVKNTKSLKGLSTSLGDVGDGLDNVTRSSGDLGDKLRGVGQISSGVSTSLSSVGGAALVAVGGILAVAAAIGTVLFFYGKHRAEAFDLELQYKKLNDRVKEYEKSLWGVEKALLKGTQGAASSLATLDSLRAQIDDVTLSENERLRAVEAIKKQYPSYFKGMSDEEILLGDVGEAYNRLTEDIIKNARAKAGLEALTENLKKQFALEKQLLDKSVELSENIYKRKTLQGLDYANKVGGAVGATGQQIIDLEEEELTLLEDHKKIGNDITDIQNESLRLSKQISDNGGILPLGGSGGSIEEGTRDAVTSIEDQVQELGGALQKGNTQLSEITDTFEPISFIDRDQLTDDEVAMRLHAAELMNTVENFEKDFENLVAGAIRETAISIGESIGEALASGESVVGAIGGSLLGSMGKFLSEMGKLLITYGALAIAKGIIDIALSSGFGPVVIAAGAAAIVVGIALVAAGAAISAKTSGAGSSGSSAGVGGGGSRTRTSSSSIGSSGGGSGGGGTYVFEIEGTKLVGVISNTLARNRALGGSLDIT